MKRVYIYNAKRSPIGKFKKAYINTDCRSLGTQVVKGLFNQDFTNKSVDKLICGNILSSGIGPNIARQIQLDSSISEDKCSMTVNMLCGSGLKAISLAFDDIRLGNSHCVVAGGVENMSRTPMLKDKYDNEKELLDSLYCDALNDAFLHEHMGITGENIAEKYNISKEEQDAFAYLSHVKAIKAFENNMFKDEIIPITTNEGNIIVNDETLRFDTSLEKIKSLKPSFKENGTITAGNASSINDGACFVLIGDETIDKKAIAEIIEFSEVGCDPKYMGMGAYYAISSLLEKTNIDIKDIDLFEINEAFASQTLAVINKLCLEYKMDFNEFLAKVNVNGGAIALGHPVGFSGARILTSLAYEMRRRKSKYGIASLCIGGGMGIAVLLKGGDK